MTRHYSQEQENYLRAKAAYEAASREVDRRMDAAGVDYDDFEAVVELGMQLHEETGYNEVLDNYIEAEKQLVAWGKRVIQAVPAYEQHKDDLLPMFDRKSRAFIKKRQQIIDTIMRLDAKDAQRYLEVA